MQSTANSAAVKQRAEDLAMQLIEGGLVTDDPILAPVCEKLMPFQKKLGCVSRDLIRQGLALISVRPELDDSAAAKACLVDLVDKLHSMRMAFGIF